MLQIRNYVILNKRNIEKIFLKCVSLQKYSHQRVVEPNVCERYVCILKNFNSIII